MAVSVDLNRLLIFKIRVEGRLQRIEYEGLPNEATVVKSSGMMELNHKEEIEEFGFWMESGDGTTGNMDGNSSITINAIMPKLGFSLGEASGSSLSGSKNKGKALQGSGLRKKGLNGVKFGSSGPQQKSDQNWDPNIMVVKGKKMSNKLGCSFWRKKVDAMMSVGDLVENISEKIDSAIRNIEVPREDGMELLETKSEEGNF
ncbi:hypothetical protein Godav_001521 [Gossypium davidsonii]|uniref:Uncharacterized protein n=1 Tax=Gossypium davidsonii TaxID=34287 RepID=A0A7J8T3B8_GOSDV|nr:hypothetical protein [Gossypium davidsonii]